MALKHPAYAVRKAALAEMRNSGGLSAKGVQVYDRAPLLPGLPAASTVRVEMERNRQSAATVQREVRLTVEVLTNPQADAPAADLVTEDVITALETAFVLTADGYHIPTDGQYTESIDWDEIESAGGETLHRDQVVLLVETLGA